MLQRIPTPYRIPWLGILVDCCDAGACGEKLALPAIVQLLAWKGKNAKKGVYEMLLKLYKYFSILNFNQIFAFMFSKKHRDEEDVKGKLHAEIPVWKSASSLLNFDDPGLLI